MLCIIRFQFLTCVCFTQGDSGGPLVKRGVDFRWDLIGIAIAGTRTCSTVKTDIKPGIYTKLAFYRDFIDVATQGACDEEYKFF